jgi:isopenicillin N synthase-like dioxygenase
MNKETKECHSGRASFLREILDSLTNCRYKAAGASAVDATGEPDTVEFLNIAKDDALAWPKQAHRTYPRTAVARMESTIVPFVRKSLEVNNLIIEIFNERLSLPAGTLLSLHTEEEYSGSEARLIRNPATQSTTKRAIGSHTDFGSLSFLHNRLGGLQVFVPGAESWQYVKPIPHHAICNVGDALAIMSGGILRSNMHRVM